VSASFIKPARGLLASCISSMRSGRRKEKTTR
jgi:hypothetical protein